MWHQLCGKHVYFFLWSYGRERLVPGPFHYLLWQFNALHYIVLISFLVLLKERTCHSGCNGLAVFNGSTRAPKVFGRGFTIYLKYSKRLCILEMQQHELKRHTSKISPKPIICKSFGTMTVHHVHMHLVNHQHNMSEGGLVPFVRSEGHLSPQMFLCAVSWKHCDDHGSLDFILLLIIKKGKGDNDGEEKNVWDKIKRFLGE